MESDYFCHKTRTKMINKSMVSLYELLRPKQFLQMFRQKPKTNLQEKLLYQQMTRMKLETDSNIAICKITKHHFETEAGMDQFFNWTLFDKESLVQLNLNNKEFVKEKDVVCRAKSIRVFQNKFDIKHPKQVNTGENCTARSLLWKIK